MARLTITRPAAQAGMVWVRQGWAVFREAAIVWSGMTAAALLVILFAGQIPYLGHYVVELLSPLLVAGYMAACRDAEQRRPVTFLHLAAGFFQSRVPLLVVGGIYLLGALLIDQVMRALGGQGLQELLALAQRPREMSPEEAQSLLDGALPALLLGMLFYTPLLLATWFAPALILFDAYKPGNAMWWSLWTCVVNWRPLLLYSLVLGVLGLVALLIPFGLGLLVFTPWAMISTYAAYRSLFVPAEPPAS